MESIRRIVLVFQEADELPGNIGGNNYTNLRFAESEPNL